MALQSEQLCASCPKRTMASKIVARVLREPDATEDCEGYSQVFHGVVITQYRQPDELAPEQSSWNSLSIDNRTNERRYSRTEWSSEKVCGQDIVEPGDGETEYGFGEAHTTKDGHAIKAFISGDENGIRDALFTLAMRHMD